MTNWVAEPPPQIRKSKQSILLTLSFSHQKERQREHVVRENTLSVVVVRELWGHVYQRSAISITHLTAHTKH